MTIFAKKIGLFAPLIIVCVDNWLHIIVSLLSMHSYKVQQRRGWKNQLYPMSTQRQLSTPFLAILASGFLAMSLLTLKLKLHSVHLASRQALLSLGSYAKENLSLD